MGEVYQARDTRLGRSVAIKMLPEIFARDPERVSRFDRATTFLQQRLTPALRRSHRVQVFDVQGRRFGDGDFPCVVNDVPQLQVGAPQCAAGRK